MSKREEIEAKIDALRAELDALPPEPLPTGKIEFSTYLHDNDMSFSPSNYLRESYAKISPEDQAKLDRVWYLISDHFEQNREKPFYEVELRCTLDLETFEIDIVRAVL